LIKVGAFDAFGTRRGLLAQVDNGLEISQRALEERRSGQQGLFGDTNEDTAARPLGVTTISTEEYEEDTLLQFEKELLGLYVSRNPLEEAEVFFAAFRSCPLSEVTQKSSGSMLNLGGRVSDVRVINTSKGQPMAFAKLEDLKGNIEMTVFPDTYAKVREHLIIDNLITVEGKTDERKGQIQVLVDTVTPLARLENNLVCHLKLEADSIEEEMLSHLKEALNTHRGAMPVIVHVCEDHEHRQISAPQKVSWSQPLQQELSELLGEGHVRLQKNGNGHH
jgi:DNA polymerase-3 subunit alpha